MNIACWFDGEFYFYIFQTLLDHKTFEIRMIINNCFVFTTFQVDQHFRTEEKLEKTPVSYDSYEEIYERLRKGMW